MHAPAVDYETRAQSLKTRGLLQAFTKHILGPYTNLGSTAGPKQTLQPEAL